MSATIKTLSKLLASAVLLVLVTGCGGGSDGDSGGDRPLSLHGITFNFPGAELTFTSASPNGSPTGTETGGINYIRTSNAAFQFLPTDTGSLDGVTLGWPADLGGDTYYQYTPIDGDSGLLLIYPDSTEGGILNGNVANGDHDIFTIFFNSDGVVVSGAQVSVAALLPTGGRATHEFETTLSLGELEGTPRDVPAGWDGVNDGPGFLATSMLAGGTLTLENGADSSAVVFSSIVEIGAGRTTTSYIQSGTLNVTYSPYPITANTEAFAAEYNSVQPFGTETTVLTLDFTSGTQDLPDQLVVTLVFSGGGELTTGIGTIGIRTGTYTATDGTAGTFVFELP